MDIILIDQYTKNILYWNPFEEYKDINFFKNIKTYYILAPKNNDNETYIWNFKITYKNENEIMLSTIKNSINSDSCIDIFIKNGIGKINYIKKCNNHRGKDLIKWTIEIIKHLGCNKCILNDIYIYTQKIIKNLNKYISYNILTIQLNLFNIKNNLKGYNIKIIGSLF